VSTGRTFKINYLLAPFSFLYGIGVVIRNWLFDWGILPSEEYPVPIISIGNLAVGGTGKTPHTEYLIHLLKDKYKLAVLSRGYKRKTKGFILSNDTSTSLTIGDEPYQIKMKFPEILVAVDSNRRRGIKNLLDLPADRKPEVILLDDAFQHRYVKPSFSILTTDYHRMFQWDMLLPAGRLREPEKGKARADVVIVTKCPDHLKPIDYRIIEDKMNLLSHQRIFFTHIVYGDLKPVFPMEVDLLTKHTILKDDKILLVAGIASSDLFVEEVKRRSDHVTTMIYPDHHVFDKQDIRKIKETFSRISSPDKYLVVTEKDAARLQNNPLVPEEWMDCLFYLPITIDFNIKPTISLDSMIENHIITLKRNIILS